MRTLILLLAILAVACEGPVGPPGAPAEIVSQMVQVDSEGKAALQFVGRRIEDTVVSCWIGESPEGPWYGVASDVVFGLLCVAMNTETSLWVQLFGGPADWFFLVTLASS